MNELHEGQTVKISFSIPFIKDDSIYCAVKRVEEDRIALKFPEDRDDIIRDLPEGREIEVVIYSNSGIYVFRSIVINSPLEHEFVIELPTEKKKIQRREYVRSPINLKVILNRNEASFETKTINIGGGGIRFVARDDFKTDDLWRFSLHLPEGKIINGVGKVLYTLIQGENTASVILFNNINETERNRIIKLCFDEEIKNLKAKKIS